MSILRTFSPRQLFLRVGDKFMPDFIDLDPDMKSGPCLLYIKLFSRCGEQDHCTVSQKELARICKCSTRSIQNHSRILSALQYVQIDRTPHEEPSAAADVLVYTLLLSPRVASLLQQAGVDTLPPANSHADGDRKSLRVPHEKFSPCIRDQDQDPPLTPQISPLPKPAMPILQTVNRVPVLSCRNTKSSSSTKDTNGRGDSFSSFSTSSWRQEFAALWAIWPDKAAWDMPRNRQLAFRAFRQASFRHELPPLCELLSIVERYKSTDSRWLRGYPPELSNWLRNRGWMQEPVVRAKKSFANLPLVNEPPARTPEQKRQDELFHQQFMAIEERLRQPALAAPVLDVDPQQADALIALWPEPEHQRMPALSFIRYLAGKGKVFDVGNLLPAAKEYLSTVSAPVSLLNWLRETHWCMEGTS